MGARERKVDFGAVRGRELAGMVLRELRAGRLDRGLGGADIAREARISRAQYSRIERGLTQSTSIEMASILLAAVGSELAVRVYPGGEPLRDAGHAVLIGRLRARIHPSIRFQTEVPFSAVGDRRAWDIVLPRYRLAARSRSRDQAA
jgi:transcriptional regulator with XRE-family HTH domain